MLKFVFPKKATTIDSRFDTYYIMSNDPVKSTVKISSIFVAFLGNMNFKGPLLMCLIKNILDSTGAHA